jgi:hypothetical protein
MFRAATTGPACVRGGQSAGRVGLIVVLSLPLVLAACGGGSPGSVTGPTPPAQTFGPIDPVLVGNWSGTLDGSFGPGSFTMTLLADGSVRTSGSGNYCAFTGSWGVTAGQFTTGGPDCTGTVVTLTAPVSGTTLSGTWSASSGRSGTFTCAKE